MVFLTYEKEVLHAARILLTASGEIVQHINLFTNFKQAQLGVKERWISNLCVSIQGVQK